MLSFFFILLYIVVLGLDFDWRIVNCRKYIKLVYDLNLGVWYMCLYGGDNLGISVNIYKI